MSYVWDPEIMRQREDGLGPEGQRLMIGDLLEDGSLWYPGWPKTNGGPEGPPLSDDEEREDENVREDRENGQFE